MTGGNDCIFGGADPRDGGRAVDGRRGIPRLPQRSPWRPGQAAAARRASGVVPAHSPGQIITVVTVETSDRASAVAVALAVVSEALRRPVVLPGQ